MDSGEDAPRNPYSFMIRSRTRERFLSQCGKGMAKQLSEIETGVAVPIATAGILGVCEPDNRRTSYVAL